MRVTRDGAGIEERAPLRRQGFPHVLEADGECCGGAGESANGDRSSLLHGEDEEVVR